MSTQTEVRERPILFSGPMVRAILDGKKTQTRRVVTPQPPEWAQHCNEARNLIPDRSAHLWSWSELEQNPPRVLRRWPVDKQGDRYAIPCPFGFPHERLWVRERHAVLDMRPECLEHPGAKRPRKDCPVSVTMHADDVSYEMTCPRDEWRESFDADHMRWRPSIHMPRWASRLSLEITGIRVERLQDIRFNVADLEAEGVALAPSELFPHTNRADKLARVYEKLWDSLNASRGYGWDANPWVWVIEFRRAED